VLKTIAKTGLLNFARERQIAESYVQRLGTKTPSVNTPVGNLSGGNPAEGRPRQVAGDRALRHSILDEPTQGVDVGAKAEILG